MTHTRASNRERSTRNLWKDEPRPTWTWKRDMGRPIRCITRNLKSKHVSQTVLNDLDKYVTDSSNYNMGFMLEIKTFGINLFRKFKKRALKNLIIRAADKEDAVNNNKASHIINKPNGDAQRVGTKRKLDESNTQIQTTKMPRLKLPTIPKLNLVRTSQENANGPTTYAIKKGQTKITEYFHMTCNLIPKTSKSTLVYHKKADQKGSTGETRKKDDESETQGHHSPEKQQMNTSEIKYLKRRGKNLRKQIDSLQTELGQCREELKNISHLESEKYYGTIIEQQRQEIDHLEIKIAKLSDEEHTIVASLNSNQNPKQLAAVKRASKRINKVQENLTKNKINLNCTSIVPSRLENITNNISGQSGA